MLRRLNLYVFRGSKETTKCAVVIQRIFFLFFFILAEAFSGDHKKLRCDTPVGAFCGNVQLKSLFNSRDQ
jgi:hypothetical protein